MSFPEKLKFIREKYNINQTEFSNALGISRSYLSKLELGHTEPTPLLINYIALAYNIDKQWLLNDSDTNTHLPNTDAALTSIIVNKYDQLNTDYKEFILNQINQLLELQKKYN